MKTLVSHQIFARLFIAFIATILFVFSVNNVSAQKMNINQDLLMFHVNGGIGLPGGDLADRFGFYGKTGAALSYRFNEKWYLSLSGDFIFNANVKEDSLLRHISTNDGRIVGIDGALYSPELQMRGWNFTLWGGRLFPTGERKNTGILTMVGAGFLQHKINYFLNQKESVPQLQDEMIKGYDRLSNGFSVSEYIGYHHMSKNTLVNFNIGIEMVQAFTKNRRGYNYDQMSISNEGRLDLMFNLKATWMLPFYRKNRVELPDDKLPLQ